MFSWYFFNCDVTSKITIVFDIIIINFLFIGNFESHIIVRMTLEKHKKSKRAPNSSLVQILRRSVDTRHLSIVYMIVMG